MTYRTFFPAVLAMLLLAASTLVAQNSAPTPPMGWNSWDSYGFTIDEEQVKANATVLASIKQFGWKYAVVDEGWYMTNPAGKTLQEKKYIWDGNGLLIPDPARYPSAAKGAGLKPLADWLHSKGLKFGIHIVRGIPRQVVDANLPIGDSSFHAVDAADISAPCPWDDGNWGIKDNAAGQAYYDSMIKLYASWGLDFLKVDCISDHPYRVSEIRQIAEAIRKAGRPIVLSLSPGPTQLEHAAEVAQYAQMWRITNDHWDAWKFEKHTPDGYPFGLEGDFDMLAKWYPYFAPGAWPDADMLPEGYIGPAPGLGPARQSRFTQDEQRTEFTLWAITRSPLILGTNLTKLDDFTRSLITNQNVLFVNQNATYSRPVDAKALGAGFENIRIWRASIGQPGDRGYAEYFAFFNLDAASANVHVTWQQLGLDGRKHPTDNEWENSTLKEAKDLSVTLPPHGSALYLVH